VELLEKIEISGSNVLADRAYGAKAIRAYISEQGSSYVIPPQSNVSKPWPVDWWLYKKRHLVECFFQKLKWFCRVATRYVKLVASFLAFVYLAAIAILLI
ncbi:MAG: transposase, partial [Oscillibacter sp.]|nr:transposase [Oscillibacter sp.]